MLTVVLMHIRMYFRCASVKHMHASAQLDEIFSGQLLDQALQLQLQQCG